MQSVYSTAPTDRAITYIKLSLVNGNSFSFENIKTSLGLYLSALSVDEAYNTLTAFPAEW